MVVFTIEVYSIKFPLCHYIMHTFLYLFSFLVFVMIWCILIDGN